MKYLDNWQAVKQRHTDFWNHTLSGPCLCAVTAQKEGAVYTHEEREDTPEERLRWWTDGPFIRKRYVDWFENAYFAGDAVPIVILDLGAAGHAGFFKGSKFRLEGSVWFDATLDSYDDLVFDPDSFLYKKTLELAQCFADGNNGSYIVGMSDAVGDADVLSHLRGPERFLMDLYDMPEAVHAALPKVQAVWEKIVREVGDIVLPGNDGGTSVGWLGTWAPGRLGQLQCDLSVMLSADAFEEFLLYELNAQSAYLDHSLYHLDGQDQVRHLDHILGVKRIDAIQWTNVVGQPPVGHFIPELQRIQQAGKNLILDCSPQELPELLDNLKASQMFVRTWVDTPQEADELIAMVARLSKG